VQESCDTPAQTKIPATLFKSGLQALHAVTFELTRVYYSLQLPEVPVENLSTVYKEEKVRVCQVT